jgi:integrase
LHADGDGLYLVVDAKGAKRWTFLFQWEGRRKEMGLGGLRAVGLADARALAADARRAVAHGQNPIEIRRANRAAEAAKAYTFATFADELITELEAQFRNAKHRQQWRMTLTRYASALSGLSLDAIGTDEVLSVLRPIWNEKPETASRLRGRIERVLDAAKARGLRSGENPARWRGHLELLLPKRRKLTRGHHAAMPYADLPAFMERLGEAQGLSAHALKWTILTACRSGEALGAEWREIDLETRIWTIPAHRTKAGREHRVALSRQAVEIASALGRVTGCDGFLLPGHKPGRPLSPMSMTMQLRRMGVDDATVHGFRSSFRDWVAEETDFAWDLAEAALAHTVGDATERAYRRGDALEKRRFMMDAWADYCST